MILHPGVISLLTGSAFVILLTLYASLLGLRILRKWDMTSSSAEQLSLERKTYLISTIMNYVLGFEILSAFLFIYTVDDLHGTFVGAMCATGSLNANPVGWYVIYTKIGIFFVSAAWLAFNHVDQRAEDYPLVKTKYLLLLIVSPLILGDTVLQTAYFLGLRPDIITSCCGALFSSDGTGIASTLSTVPVVTMMVAYYAVTALFLLTFAASLRYDNLRYASILLAPAVFTVSIMSVVSFISLYFYELPTHHCPFDILQAGSGYIGYPLYGTLYGGTFFGLITGLIQPFRSIPSLSAVIPALQRKWILMSLLLISAFTIMATWPIVFGSFTLEGYY